MSKQRSRWKHVTRNEPEEFQWVLTTDDPSLEESQEMRRVGIAWFNRQGTCNVLYKPKFWKPLKQ